MPRSMPPATKWTLPTMRRQPSVVFLLREKLCLWHGKSWLVSLKLLEAGKTPMSWQQFPLDGEVGDYGEMELKSFQEVAKARDDPTSLATRVVIADVDGR